MVGIFGLKPQTINYALNGAVRAVAGTAIFAEYLWIAVNHIKLDLTKSINRSAIYATVLTGAVSLYLLSISAAYFVNAYRAQKGQADLLPIHKWKLILS